MADNKILCNLLSAKDIQIRYKIGTDKAYELLHSDGFPAFKIKGRYYIHEGLLDQWEKNQIIRLQKGA